jgi:hypothetical protein
LFGKCGALGGSVSIRRDIHVEDFTRGEEPNHRRQRVFRGLLEAAERATERCGIEEALKGVRWVPVLRCVAVIALGDIDDLTLLSEKDSGRTDSDEEAENA